MEAFEEKIWNEARRSRGVLATCISTMLSIAPAEEVEEVAACAWKRRAAEYWSVIFAELGGAATTPQIARYTKRSKVSVHSMMNKLVYYQLIERDGSVLGPQGGRPQALWKWVA